MWNEPFHQETRDVCLRTHALRNLILDEDPYFGLRFTDARYGIFVTASYYPCGAGRMVPHADGVKTSKPLLHSLVPITFQGKDYKAGGMVVVNRNGQEIDVDREVEPGDVVFYDGALKHGVPPIVALDGKDLGRLQVFPIPTVFRNLENDIDSVSRIPVSRFLDAKLLWLKNLIRIRLGRQPSMR